MKVNLDLKDTQLEQCSKKVQFPLGTLNGTITKTCLNYYLALQLDTLVQLDNQPRQSTLKCLTLDCKRELEPTGDQQTRWERNAETFNRISDVHDGYDQETYT